MNYHLGCPQCGAPLELGETEQIIECPYCRVRHILVIHDHVTCCLAPRNTTVLPEDTVYVPYWRFKGLGFALQGPQITHRIMDLSAPATSIKGLPPSLGLRPQTQSLHFIHHDTRAGFLPITIKQQHLLHHVGSRLLGSGPRKRIPPLQSYIGDLVQLVYSPLILRKNRVFDAITGTSIPGCDEEELREKSVAFPGRQPGFLPALCPHCGWDLSGHKESLCQACTHCQRLWVSLNGGLHAMEFQFAGQADQNCTWFPFWQMDVENAEASLKNRADMILLANLPRIPTPEDRLSPLQFTIPAFKLNPTLFLRLARQTTIFHFQDARKVPLHENFFPCALPLTEAWQAISPLLYDLARDKTEIQTTLTRSNFRLKHCRMLFLPFTHQGMELIQPDMNVSLPANSVLFGQSL